MPYNMTPINPSSEVTGTCSLPLARIQRIIKADPDTGDCSKNAAFAIAVATEMFVQHLVEKTQAVVATDSGRGGRAKKSIQYKHVAAAVAKFDNLEFLSDVVPSTITMREYQKMQRSKGKGETGKAGDVLTNGQKTLVWAKPETMNDEEHANGSARSAQQGTGETAASETNGTGPAPSRQPYDAVREAYDANANGDVAMEED